jgi:hypothetical protein
MKITLSELAHAQIYAFKRGNKQINGNPGSSKLRNLSIVSILSQKEKGITETVCVGVFLEGNDDKKHRIIAIQIVYQRLTTSAPI